MSFITPLRAAIVAAILGLAAPAHADGIKVHDSYAIAATPAAMSGAAFMVIQNQGGVPDRLIGVRSDAAVKVELHTHIAGADGVMQMVHVKEGFPLPADGEILMERGGNHVMFMGLTNPFVQGEVLTLTLEFEVAGDVTIEVPIDLERMTGDAMDHGSMDNGSMDNGTAQEAASE